MQRMNQLSDIDIDQDDHFKPQTVCVCVCMCINRLLRDHTQALPRY